MLVIGIETVNSLFGEENFLLKLVAHDTIAYFFQHTFEHRDMKVPGLSYEDESKSNAVAAMVKQGRIDFRFHRSFTDGRIRKIAEDILSHPEVPFRDGFIVTYQGRVVVKNESSQ